MACTGAHSQKRQRIPIDASCFSCLSAFISLPAKAMAMQLAEQKVAELRAALAQNQAEIRKFQQAARRRAAFLERGGLSCLSVRKVLAVYILSKWDLPLALLAAQRLSCLPKLSEAFPTTDFVRTLFVQYNRDDLLNFHDDRAWAKARSFAKQFVCERDAWLWVKQQNLSKGVAPSATELYHYYESKALDPIPVGEPRRRTLHRWVGRWRRRWGVRRTHLRPADPVDPTILRQKVRRGPI